MNVDLGVEFGFEGGVDVTDVLGAVDDGVRSEERRVGKECRL